MSINKTLKNNAKQALKGNRLRAIAVISIVILSELAITFSEGAILLLFENFGVADYINQNIFTHMNFNLETIVELLAALICGIISLLFLSPIIMGEIRWLCEMFDKNSPKIRQVFYFFKSPHLYFKSVFLTMSVAIQRIFWAIAIFIVPTTAFAFSSVLLKSDSQTSHGFGIIAMLLGTGFFALGIIFYAKIYFGFSLAFNVLAEKETMTVHEAIKISKQAMCGKEWRYLLLKISFFPWLTLGLFVIPILFIMPYYHACHVAFARRYLKEHNNKKEHNMA